MVSFVRLGCMVTNIKGDVIFARDLARKSLGFQGFTGCLSGISCWLEGRGSDSIVKETIVFFIRLGCVFLNI